MLTALEKATKATVALPDFRSPTELERLRERTRQGNLVCRTCQEPLWLHAGTVRTPHFAHRSLQNCPSARVSEAVLGVRGLLYWFFKPRIESGKLAAEIELEPAPAELPDEISLDLLLRRSGKPPVAILICESSLKPVLRELYPAVLEKQGWIFRPVFLQTRLKPEENSRSSFLLDPTQRDLQQPSPYDRCSRNYAGDPGTLHFVDPEERRWTTLRGLSLVHEPQVFRAHSVRSSAEEQLLWSETHAEWAHKGEAEELKAFLQRLREKRRRETAPPPVRPRSSARSTTTAQPPDGSDGEESRDAEEPAAQSPLKPSSFVPKLEPKTVEQPEPLPPWVRGSLLCVGCGKQTTEWQNARPMDNLCVCRECFARGTRLPR